MATAQEIVNRAAFLLGLTDGPNQAADTDVSAEMFVALQDMIAEFSEDGMLEIPVPSALTDTFDISPATNRALRFNLAADYGAAFSTRLTARTMQIAERTRSRLVGDGTVSKRVNLRNLGMGVSHGRYNVRNDA